MSQTCKSDKEKRKKGKKSGKNICSNLHACLPWLLMIERDKKRKGESRQTRKQALPHVVDFLNNDKSLCGGKSYRSQTWWAFLERTLCNISFFLSFLSFLIESADPSCSAANFLWSKKCTSGELVSIVLFYKIKLTLIHLKLKGELNKGKASKKRASFALLP